MGNVDNCFLMQTCSISSTTSSLKRHLWYI